MNNRKLVKGKVWTGNSLLKWADSFFVECGEIKFF